MILNHNDDNFYENPDEVVIHSVLSDLPRDEFAILSQQGEVYIQAYHNEDGTFQLEYRAGSYDKHFGADPNVITREDVQNAFTAFLNGNPEWFKPWSWERIEFDEDFQGGCE